MSTPLDDALLEHIALLRPYGAGLRKAGNDFYFVDAGLLNGDYANLFSRSMMVWHQITARWNQDYFRSGRRRLIRRFVPLIRKCYTAEEIRLIKYVLHIQLALGFEVLISFVNSNSFLHEAFGADNSVVVKKGIVIDMHRPYEASASCDLLIERNPSLVADRYLALEDISKSHGDSFLLRYDSHSFTCHRRSDCHTRHAPFLYALQSGLCAITGEMLDGFRTHVDHIYPLGSGGNNSLINLQLTRDASNLLKGESRDDSSRCLSQAELKERGFSSQYHDRFIDRKMTGVGIGLDALFERVD